MADYGGSRKNETAREEKMTRLERRSQTKTQEMQMKTAVAYRSQTAVADTRIANVFCIRDIGDVISVHMYNRGEVILRIVRCNENPSLSISN